VIKVKEPGEAYDYKPDTQIMEKGPLVSVIIPVKNGERFLEAAINSVLEQGYKRYELIVVDGKSTDRSPFIAKSFQVVRYLLQKDEGFGNALNAGIDVAAGELIAFTSFDDLWVKDKLSIQVSYLMQHPEVQYSITKVRYFLEESDAIPPGFRRELLAADQSGYMPETLMVRKSLFDSVGKFRSDMKISADVDWFARAKDLHIPMALIPEVLVYKRVHGANSTLAPNQVRTMNHELLKSLQNSIERQRRDLTEKKEIDGE
jgi:glycosyltransferase involved in cell wall biosynthesis